MRKFYTNRVPIVQYLTTTKYKVVFLALFQMRNTLDAVEICQMALTLYPSDPDFPHILVSFRKQIRVMEHCFKEESGRPIEELTS
jgi:hypothetical protein